MASPEPPAYKFTLTRTLRLAREPRYLQLVLLFGSHRMRGAHEACRSVGRSLAGFFSTACIQSGARTERQGGMQSPIGRRQKGDSPPDQSMTDCVRDEEAAKQQLNTLWEETPVSIRKRCESDARSLGTLSYLDLLSCIQIGKDLKADSKKDAGKH